MTDVNVKNKLSVKAQTLYTLGAITAAVLLPQLLHIMGAVSGTGTALGETFLPMHLPIILVGFLAGPYAGAVSGLVSPLLSFAFTGMPKEAMLPFMMIELLVYGLTAGLLSNVKIPAIAKVLIVQISGRAVRAAAILIAVYALKNTAVPAAVIWNSITAGIFGIALQWALIPLIIYRVENKND